MHSGYTPGLARAPGLVLALCAIPMLCAVLALCIVLLFIAGCGRSTHKPVELRAETGSASMQSGQAGAPGEQALYDQALLESEQAQAILRQLEQRLVQEFAERGIDAEKHPAAAPSGADNAVFDLDAEVVDPDGDGPGIPTGIALSWTEQLIGDYDQNSEVNAADITPLAKYLGQKVTYDDPGLHGGFAHWPEGDPEGAGALNWRKSRVDGDFNGELNITDITPISVHWKEQLSGYLIERAVNYGTGVLLWDEQPLDIGFGTAPSAPHSLTFEPGKDAPYANRPARYMVDVTLSDAEYAQQYRVRALDTQSGGTGEASNIVHYYPSAAMDTTPPVWVGTVGIAALVPRHEALKVYFGTAVDDQSPPVSYRVYWAVGDPEQPGAPFDYEAADYADVAAGPYEITGLTDDVYYRAAVRAADSADPPNRERNAVVLGRKAGPQDIYPPEWQGRVGLADLMFGNGAALLIWDAAVDSHTDAYGTWESGPVIYRVYYGQGYTPDLSAAFTRDFEDLGLEHYIVPLHGLDTTKAHWFCVRARDQAEYPNEDDNEVIYVRGGFDVIDLPVPGLGPGVPTGAEITHKSDLCYDSKYEQVFYVTQSEYTSAVDPSQIETWLSVWYLNDTAFEFVYDYHACTNTNGITFSDMVFDDFCLKALVTTGGGLYGGMIQHFDLSCEEPEQVKEYVTSEMLGYTPLGAYFPHAQFDINGNPWCILCEGYGPSLIEMSYRYYATYLPSTELVPFWQSSQMFENLELYNYSKAKLAGGKIAFMANRSDPPYETYQAIAEGSSVTLTEFIPSSEDSDLTYGVFGINTRKPLWLERSDYFSDDDYWYRLFNDDFEVIVRDDPAFEASDTTWHVQNQNNYVAITDSKTTNCYESPGEKTYFIVVDLTLAGWHSRIPFRSITGSTWRPLPPRAIIKDWRFITKIWNGDVDNSESMISIIQPN